MRHPYDAFFHVLSHVLRHFLHEKKVANGRKTSECETVGESAEIFLARPLPQKLKNYRRRRSYYYYIFWLEERKKKKANQKKLTSTNEAISKQQHTVCIREKYGIL